MFWRQRARRWAHSLEGRCTLIFAVLGALFGLYIGGIGIAARGGALGIPAAIVMVLAGVIFGYAGRRFARFVHLAATSLRRWR